MPIVAVQGGVPSTSWGQWARERWQALLLLSVGLPLAVLCAQASRYWIGRPFPGFFLMANCVVPTVYMPAWSMQGRVAPHARVEAVGTDAETARTAPPLYGIDCRDAVYAAVASQKIGSPVAYRVVADGVESVAMVPTQGFGTADFWLTVGLFLSNGLVVLAAAVVVGLLQPTTLEARGFLAFGAVFAGVLFTGPPLYHPDMAWLTGPYVAFESLWPAAFVHLGLVFPSVSPRIARHPRLLLVPYLLAAVLAVWVWVGFSNAPPDLLGLWVMFGITAVSMAFATVRFAWLYRSRSSPLEHARYRVVLWGFVLATTLAAIAFLDNSQGGGRFPINLSILTPAIFYVATGWAIVRHDLFDIDRLVRQAAVYTTLSAAITAAYATTLSLVGRFAPTSTSVVSIAFVVAVAIAFEPLRLRVQRIVDRMFFRQRVNYRRAVREVSSALTSLLDLDQVLARVGSTLIEGLSPTTLGVALWVTAGSRAWRFSDQGGPIAMPSEPFADIRSFLRTQPQGAIHVGRHEVRAGTADPASPTDAPALIVPLVQAGTLIGAFVFGPKRSGLPYNREDVDLIDTLAAQSAVSLQNALLFAEVRELNEGLEAKVQSRTAELEASNTELGLAYRRLQDAQAQLLQSEKMASLGQLVAGLAHEINSPVTAVVGNVVPLQRELERLGASAAKYDDAALSRTSDRIRTMVELVSEGATRTAAIVKDLRVYSRIDEDRPLAMDLHEAIDVTLRILKHRWEHRITLHRDYGAVPPLEAIPGQVNQVLMNLLANACDAIADGGNVWISTSSDGLNVTLRVRDDGVGMATAVRERIFDPFFTTKPIGKGMGLGLAITASIVAAHGGTIGVESVEGQGTTFVVCLPVRARRG